MSHRQGDERRDLAAVTVPPHHCFVLGDNRNESLDNRSFGPLPLVAITGRVEFRYARVRRMGAIH